MPWFVVAVAVAEAWPILDSRDAGCPKSGNRGPPIARRAGRRSALESHNCGEPIGCGQPLARAIDLKGESNTFAFTALAGQTCPISTDETGGSINACWEVYDPVGAVAWWSMRLGGAEVQGSAMGIARTIAGLQTKRLSALDKLNALKCPDANQKLDDLIASVTGNRKIVSGADAVVDAASAAQACITEFMVETGCR